MNQDKRILILLVIVLFSLFGVFAIAQEQITLTTYYPAPFGEYERIRLVPPPAGGPAVGAACNPATEAGIMLYSATANSILTCDATTSQWQQVGGGGLWTEVGGELYPIDSTWRVGMGVLGAPLAAYTLSVNSQGGTGTIGIGGTAANAGVRAATSSNYGVYANSTSSTGVAGIGSSFGVIGGGDTSGIYGYNTTGPGGIAGYFDGSVNIGTINPGARLELSDKSWIKLNAYDSAGAPDIAGINFDEWGNGTATDVQYGASIRYNEDNDRLELVTKQNWADRYGIAIGRSTGYVGIGTNNPGANLDVLRGVIINSSGATNPALQIRSIPSAIFLQTAAGVNRGAINVDGNDVVIYGNDAGWFQAITIDNDGTRNVGIGTTTPNLGRLHVYTSSGNAIYSHTPDDGGQGVWGNGTGNFGTGVLGIASGNGRYGVRGAASAGGQDFYAFGAGNDYGSASSIRWKKNIKPIDNALSRVLKLRGVYFDWDEEHGSKHDIGMIAEDVGEIFPEVVTYEPNSTYTTGMDYSRLTTVLVEAIKELEGKNRELEFKIRLLESKLNVGQ